MAGATQRTKQKSGADRPTAKPTTGSEPNSTERPRRSRAARLSIPALDLSESKSSGVLRPKSRR
jgi:hypothetical protein